MLEYLRLLIPTLLALLLPNCVDSACGMLSLAGGGVRGSLMLEINTRRLLRPLFILCVLAGWLGVHSVASADVRINQPHQGSRPLQLSMHAGFSYYGLSPNAGLRFDIPIVANGFVSKINNAIHIGVGADFYFGDWDRDGRYAAGVGIPIMFNWEFFFTEKWSAFGEVGPNLMLWRGMFDDGVVFHPGWIGGAAGGRLHLSDRLALVLRVGSPYTAFGLTLKM